MPGVAAVAANADGTIFEGAAGTLQSDGVIWIASMTKAITGAAAMQMVEQGKFGLDTPAADIVPEIARKEVLVGIGADGTVTTRPARKPITLRHLLTHTSGMGYDTWNADIFRYVQAKGPLKPNSMEMLSTPLLADPGERWEYGIGMDWVGQLIEAATSGNEKFFLGTDSAPHAVDRKEAACGCAGCYTAHAALPLYAEAFERAGALARLEAFASEFGPRFYGLPLNDAKVRLVRQPWTVPPQLPLGDATVKPLLAGETLQWQAFPL